MTTSPLTNEQRAAAATVILGILDAIGSAGKTGAPAGPMFAVLAAHGCTLENFRRIMASLMRSGTVSRQGDCYTFTDARLHGRN